jgi:CheY-like chemotaxis protein
LWRPDSKPGRIDSILHSGDRRHAAFLAGVDLVIHDAQYTPEEYTGKKNWGHSTYEYVVEIAVAAGVKSVALTHHDPVHDDDFLESMQDAARVVAARRGSPLRVFCANEGWTQPLVGAGDREAAMSRPSAEPTDGGRVLIVDDDPDLRALARMALAKGGFIVLEAGSAAEALQSVLAAPPSMVVLDVLMPEVDGLELLRRLRELPALQRLPVLMLTSLDDPQSIRRGFELGCTDYLTKPFSMPQLTARVRACLARPPE